MYGRAMCVSVNDAADSGDSIGLFDRFRIHIHDFRDRSGCVLAAASASLVREQFPVGKRQSQKTALPRRGSHDAAQFLLGMVVDTKRVAMSEEHALAVEFRHDWIREQPTSRLVAEAAAEEEVPVSVEYETRDAA